MICLVYHLYWVSKRVADPRPLASFQDTGLSSPYPELVDFHSEISPGIHITVPIRTDRYTPTAILVSLACSLAPGASNITLNTPSGLILLLRGGPSGVSPECPQKNSCQDRSIHDTELIQFFRSVKFDILNTI